MKPPKFQTGQFVASLIDAPGINGTIKKDSIYQVTGVEFMPKDGEWHISPDTIDMWPERYFAPIEELPAEALEALLEESFAIHA